MAKSQKDRRRSACPISFTLDTLGDKWALLIVRDLMFLGKRNYGQFLESDEGIATNILADRLRRLEKEGIISKQRDPANRKKFVYRFTEKGADLLPILLEMVLWGARYDPETGAPEDFIRRLKRGRNSVMRQILKK